MALSKETKKLLNLSPLEVKVFEVLEKHGSLSMQELSEKTHKARTTVYWPLQQLYKRGLVGYDVVGKRKRWYANTNTLPESKEKTVTVVEGVEAMQKLYNKALLVGRNERVIILEGIRAVHSLRKKGGLEFMTRWHTRAHEKKIIIESILGKKTYEDVAMRQVDPLVVRSLARWETWIGYVVPDEWINTNTAVVVFRNGAILADWDKEQALFVQTPGLVALLKNFCTVCQTFGKKVDIVGYVRAHAQKES